MSSFNGILNKLADGRFHSGEVLAAEFNVTRAAIWKYLKKIEAMGLGVDAVRGKGYRLQAPLELLDTRLISKTLAPPVASVISGLTVHNEIDSTNRFLLRQQQDEAIFKSGHVCLAESQTAGQGRRGRQWISPFGSNIYLSVLWRYTQGPAGLSGLSLALGVGVMRVLSQYVDNKMGLKWPNDIYYGHQKLAGILVEINGEAHGPCTLVAGLGLNVNMGGADRQAIDQPWTDLQTIVGEQKLSRNQLAGQLIEQMLTILKGYPEHGFRAYQQEWAQWDIMSDKAVCITSMGGERHGTVKGIDQEGNLLLQTGQGLQVVHSGEVSLRLQA